MKKYIVVLTVALVGLTACQHDIERQDLFLTESEAVQQLLNTEPYGYYIYDEANGGLNQFVADYMTEEGNYRTADTIEYRTRSDFYQGSNHYYLFSIDTIPAAGKGIYIRGRIVTDDYAGNFYKSFVLQQIVGGKQQTLRLSVDAGSGSGLYQMGQEVLIRVNGLAIGRYANQPQLCVPSYNNNIHAQNAAQKIGWLPGRIPSAMFSAATTFIGLPDQSKIVIDDLDLADISTTTAINDVIAARTLDGHLVRVKNIHFTGKYADTSGNAQDCTEGDPEDDENANVFAPTTKNVGYPQSRIIVDANNVQSLISTSEYAKYAHYYLPAAEYTGTAVGILSYYFDNGSKKPNWTYWSISLRNLGDLDLVNAEGDKWIPLEWTPKKDEPEAETEGSDEENED